MNWSKVQRCATILVSAALGAGVASYRTWLMEPQSFAAAGEKQPDKQTYPPGGIVSPTGNG
jgi:hypothetical protein